MVDTTMVANATNEYLACKSADERRRVTRKLCNGLTCGAISRETYEVIKRVIKQIDTDRRLALVDEMFDKLDKALADCNKDIMANK